MRNLILLFTFFSFQLQAQDLLSLLNNEEDQQRDVIAVFKDSRIVNAQSSEQSSKGELKFLIQHRFGTINQGSYALWGIDDAKVRFGFEYGLSEMFTLALGRSSDKKQYDTSVKAKLKKQTTTFPISISTFSAFFQIHPSDFQRQRTDFDWSDFQSFSNQIILTKKLSQQLSLAILPTHLYDNEINQRFFAGFGGRFKISKRVSINGEYFYPINKLSDTFNYLAVGFDIDTGGHVFSLHLSNSRGMNEHAFLTEVADLKEGNIYFGFNISRNFAW